MISILTGMCTLIFFDHVELPSNKVALQHVYVKTHHRLPVVTNIDYKNKYYEIYGDLHINHRGYCSSIVTKLNIKNKKKRPQFGEHLYPRIYFCELCMNLPLIKVKDNILYFKDRVSLYNDKQLQKDIFIYDGINPPTFYESLELDPITTRTFRYAPK